MASYNADSEGLATNAHQNSSQSRICNINREERDGTGVRLVQYSLTELGRGFITPLTSMCSSAKQHGKDVSAEVNLVEIQQR
jgi:maltoporin